jgi:hypothetical protein
LNLRWISTESVEIPTIRAPSFEISACRSRYAWTSRVQPPVKAFG